MELQRALEHAQNNLKLAQEQVKVVEAQRAL
jgi:hypothetical protein